MSDEVKCFPTGDELVESMGEAWFSEHMIELIAPLVRPALTLLVQTGNSSPVGGSHIGGCPDPPDGTSWPVRDPARRPRRPPL